MFNEKKKSVMHPIEFSETPAELPVCFDKTRIMENPKDDEAVVPVYFDENLNKRPKICPIDFLDTVEGAEIQQQSPVQTSSQIIKAKESKTVEEVTGDIANYELLPKLKKIYIDAEGKIDMQKTEIVCNIIINERHEVVKGEITVRSIDIEKITKVVNRQYPTAIIYDKKDAPKVENDFREKLSRIPVKRCYTNAGWQLIDGRHVYVHNTMNIANSEIITNLNLPLDKRFDSRQLAGIWYNAQSLYKGSDIISVLLLFSLLGVSYKIFEEAGFPIHFLLFINGKTGSLKTSLSKVLYTQLAEEKYRNNPRRIDADTVASLERALVLSGRDTVTLIDDYAPAKSLQKKNEMANKLECIVRMVGDGSTKSRSNVTLEDCRGEGVRGVVVLTGELRGSGLSSNLRCLYCEVEKELVDLHMLSWFQENKYAYTTLIQHFVYYLSDKWNRYVSYIAEQYELKRKKAEPLLRSRRLIDTLAALWITADIMEQFMLERCEPSTGIHDSFELMRENVVSVVVRSELLSEDENPALIFMRALETLLSNNKLLLKSERLLAGDIAGYAGFRDGNFLYLLPDVVYEAVSSWLRKGGVYLGLDLNQLGNVLCNEGYAVSTSNGANKKLYYARIEIEKGNKVKFIKIPKAVLQKLQDEEWRK